MFQPNQHDVRRFFCAAFAATQRGVAADPMQAIAMRWVDEHPEYHADLADEAAALAASYAVESGRENPFLHLAMHLTLEEQASIDQPTGIRQAIALLAARRGSLHAAHHEAMECLGEMLWASQRSGRPPDGEAYLEAVRRRATAG
jgi:hypothetical protein